MAEATGFRRSAESATPLSKPQSEKTGTPFARKPPVSSPFLLRSMSSIGAEAADSFQYVVGRQPFQVTCHLTPQLRDGHPLPPSRDQESCSWRRFLKY